MSDQITQHFSRMDQYEAGARSGAAQLYGYSYLFGREALLLKETCGHGNKDGEEGFKKLLEKRYPSVPYRTIARRMEFKQLVDVSLKALPNPTVGKSDTVALIPNSFEIPEKLTPESEKVILEVVPQIMDGKGMVAFMRDSQLLRDPEQPKHTPAKTVTPEEAVAAQNKLAAEAWQHITALIESAFEAGHDARISKADRMVVIGAFVTGSKRLRALNKKSKGQPAEPVAKARKRTLSAAARAKLVANARARWAKIREARTSKS